MSDAMSRYMTTVVQYPLLTKGQEIMLARQVQLWVNDSNPSKQVERQGKRAYEKLINCNLRLVISIARRYLPRCRRTDMLDIIQEGNIGLAHGVKKFDPERGYALSTYTYWWIRQAITRYLSTNDRLIKLPSHAVDMLAKMRGWIPLFAEEHGRQPTIEECAEYCGTNPTRMADYMERATDAASLDRVVADGSDISLVDCLSNGDDLMDQLEADFDIENIRNSLDRLSDDDRFIVEAVFALNRNEKATFQQLGRELGVSRERIRQRFNRILIKLRLIYVQQSSL